MDHTITTEVIGDPDGKAKTLTLTIAPDNSLVFTLDGENLFEADWFGNLDKIFFAVNEIFTIQRTHSHD